MVIIIYAARYYQLKIFKLREEFRNIFLKLLRIPQIFDGVCFEIIQQGTQDYVTRVKTILTNALQWEEIN